MKSLKLQISGSILLAACLMMPVQSLAQWSLGASYEMREEVPENGFGVQIEREIYKPIPIIELGLRLHGSFFREENEFEADGLMVSRDIEYCDFGLAVKGGVSLVLLKPYVGVGIGNNTFDIEEGNSESNFFWNGFGGVELTPIPRLNPYIEYRLQPTDEFENLGEDIESSDGRFIIGLSLSF